MTHVASKLYSQLANFKPALTRRIVWGPKFNHLQPTVVIDVNKCLLRLLGLLVITWQLRVSLRQQRLNQLVHVVLWLLMGI